jgi:hypothetical protein
MGFAPSVDYLDIFVGVGVGAGAAAPTVDISTTIAANNRAKQAALICGDSYRSLFWASW